MNTESKAAPAAAYPKIIKAGYGFNVGQDFARAKTDLPCRVAAQEYARPGHVIAYTPAQLGSNLGFLRIGDRNGEIRVHVLESALAEAKGGAA